MTEAIGKHAAPSRLKLVLAFAAVYVIWGSTYLAIRYAIETLPPFLMAAARFLVAGAILYLLARWQGTPHPATASWKPAAVAGAFLLLGGNGSLVWAEKRVASGLAALLIATEPLWIVMLEWIRPGGARPERRTAAGLLCGFAGMVFLVNPFRVPGAGSVDLLGSGLLIFGSLCWAIGSLYSIRSRPSPSPLMGAGMQMLAGGFLMLIAGLVAGEAWHLSLAGVSLRSIGAAVYLMVFGSLIGFTSYIWLLRVTTPAISSTYAYVNPVVAVFLGWAVGGEVVSARTLLAAAIIIAGVVLITTSRGRSRRNLSPGQEDRSGA